MHDGLDSVPYGVPEVEDRAKARFLLILVNHTHFNRLRQRDDISERVEVASQHGVSAAFAHLKELRHVVSAEVERGTRTSG